MMNNLFPEQIRHTLLAFLCFAMLLTAAVILVTTPVKTTIQNSVLYVQQTDRLSMLEERLLVEREATRKVATKLSIGSITGNEKQISPIIDSEFIRDYFQQSIPSASLVQPLTTTPLSGDLIRSQFTMKISGDSDTIHGAIKSLSELPVEMEAIDFKKISRQGNLELMMRFRTYELNHGANQTVSIDGGTTDG